MLRIICLRIYILADYPDIVNPRQVHGHLCTSAIFRKLFGGLPQPFLELENLKNLLGKPRGCSMLSQQDANFRDRGSNLTKHS